MTNDKLPGDKNLIRMELERLCLHFGVEMPQLVFKARRTSFYIFKSRTIVISVSRRDYWKDGFQSPLYHEFAHHLVEVKHGRQRRHHGAKFKECFHSVLFDYPFVIGSYRYGREYTSIAKDLRYKHIINAASKELLG